MPQHELTLDHLWSSLKEEEISQGCVALFKPCHPVLDKRKTAAMHRIADIRNTRINSIRANSPEKNTEIFLKFVRSKNHSDFWDDIIQAFLLGPHFRPKLGRLRGGIYSIVK